VEPNSDTVSNAAEGMASKMPEDLRFEITNAEGAQAYPISGIVYVLAYKEQRDAKKGEMLANFLWWAIHDGEKFVRELHYAPIPAGLVTKTEAKINSLVNNGVQLRKQ
jgi:phosphate transport system substrate-binding protein